MFRVIYETAPFTEETTPVNTHVCPMPNTIEVGGKVLCDSLTDTLPELADNIIGVWCKQGVCQHFKEEAFKAYLAPVIEYDDEGNEVTSTPRPVNQVHGWAGWPEIGGGDAT